MPKISAGLLMFRRKNNLIEVFLAHHGGPLFKYKDEGSWTLPKGEVENGQELLAEACREFSEETGITPPEDAKFIPLGTAVQKSGKIVHAWAFENDFNGPIISNNFTMEWPIRSGKMQEFPEVDRAEFFSIDAARKKIIQAQQIFIDRLLDILKPGH